MNVVGVDSFYLKLLTGFNEIHTSVIAAHARRSKMVRAGVCGNRDYQAFQD